MEFKVIHGSGANGKGLQSHTCNVCDEINFWTDEHGYIERPVGNPFTHEIIFIICSNKCRRSPLLREKYIKWLSTKIGWSKKTATQNFNDLIDENGIPRIEIEE